MQKQTASRFWRASTTAMTQGYMWDSDAGAYVCLVCGEAYEQGQVYPDGKNRWFEAEKAMQQHAANEHGSMLEWLLSFPKDYTGLSDVQMELIYHIAQGRSSGEIARCMGDISPSTVRNHRRSLREREKQAKVFLAVMELLREREAAKAAEAHTQTERSGAAFSLPQEEHDRLIRTYFRDGPDGPLSALPPRETRRVAVLGHIINRFEMNHAYSEREVNAILREVYPEDHLKIRRYLIEYGFLDRVRDGSTYWVKPQ